jgi:Cdc6-like AAA superfamily ATPase
MVLDTLKEVKIDSGILRGVSEVIQSEVVPGIKKIQSEQNRNKELQRRQEIEKKFLAQMEWLKSGNIANEKHPGEILAANKRNTHRDTTDWILSETKFKLWRDSFRSTLAWVSGDGGFGKSFLLSTIIDHLQSPEYVGPSGKPHIVYFFCKRGNEATSVGTNIFLHLLLQLYQHAAPSYPGSTLELQEVCSQIIEETVQKLKPEVRQNSSLVKLKSVLQPLFEDIAEAFGSTVIIVVDGLDECIDVDRGLLDALCELPEDSNIRVLISSRPDIYRKLGRPIKFHINLSSQTSQEQILKYVKHRVKYIKAFTPKMRAKVCARILEQSGGNFRCKYT